MHFKGIQCLRIFSDPKAKLHNSKSWTRVVVFVFLFCFLIQWILFYLSLRSTIFIWQYSFTLRCLINIRIEIRVRSCWKNNKHTRFRSFNAKNLGSVGQRAAKLPAVKVGGLKKSLPAGPGTTRTSQPRFESWRRLNHSQSLMAGNFVAL